jgi:hypothetical protein
LSKPKIIHVPAGAGPGGQRSIRLGPRTHRALIWNQTHLLQILRQYQTHHNQHRPHRALDAATPLKPLPEPADLGQYRIRRQARVGGLINERRLVA